MRGEDQRSEGFFSYVRLESRTPTDHPSRAVRALVDPPSFDRRLGALTARPGPVKLTPAGREKI